MQRESTRRGACAAVAGSCVLRARFRLARLGRPEPVARTGYLAVADEGMYLPAAIESVPREALRRLYWGSHSYHESAAVTTFGDHCSVPRTGRYDLYLSLGLRAPEPVKARAAGAARLAEERQAVGGADEPRPRRHQGRPGPPVRDGVCEGIRRHILRLDSGADRAGPSDATRTSRAGPSGHGDVDGRTARAVVDRPGRPDASPLWSNALS